MIRLTEDYAAGALPLGALVGELEGALDAGDFRDKLLREDFYRVWGPLEVHYATRGDGVSPAEISADLNAVRRLLDEHLAESTDENAGADG